MSKIDVIPLNMNIQKPFKLSICIPTYNRYKSLKALLVKLTNQNLYENVQIVREKKATYIQSPNNINLVKKFNNIPENAIIAGDWTQYNLPCTIEASILSGKKAIETI